jgi:hypothetical protein
MNGSGLREGTIHGTDQFWNGIGRLSLGQVLDHLQRAFINFDVLGLTNGAVANLGLLISLFHQPTRNNDNRRYDHMKTTLPMRLRILRFLEERRVHRARPHYFPELALFGVIVIIAVWPMLSLAAALRTLR